MNVEWWISSRYFKGRGFVAFIKNMAIAGIAVGSAGLMISLSIVHGFRSVIQEKTLEFAPHLTVSAPFADGIFRADTLIAFLERIPEVGKASAMMADEVMVEGPGGIAGGALMGIDADGGATQIAGFVERGGFDLSGAVIGAAMARSLKADTGSVLTLYSIRDHAVGTSQGGASASRSPGRATSILQVRVSGVYKTGIDRFDDGFVFLGIEEVRRFSGRGPLAADQIQIRIGPSAGSGGTQGTSGSDAERLEPWSGRDLSTAIITTHSDLQASLGFPYVVESIYQTQRNLFEWIQLQEQTIPVVIGIMVVIAAFNLIGAVLMMVLERVRDIGVLKTLGLADSSIRAIFLWEGLWVATAGMALGLAVFSAFVLVQTKFEVFKLQEANYYMSSVPVEPHALDLLIVIVSTLALSLAASWLPARVAAKTDPVTSIHFNRGGR